jgi:microcystin-dependent protein
MTSYFPSEPTVGQLYENYTWTGEVWKRLGSNVNTGPDFIENNLIDVNYIPPSVARTESPTFTGTVDLPATTNIGEVSHTEIQTLNGVSHSVQDQLNTKATLDSPTFTGTVVLPSATSIASVSATEIGYLDGVTGNIQTQINGKTTASYVDNAVSTAVANVIDTAPSTLNTLNELAAALGDDPNFATTITELIANKISNVPGMISQYAGSSLPSGWLWCDGGDIQVSTHQNLYNALTSNGTVFPYGPNTNANGVIYFKVPNFTGRVPVGRDSAQTEFDVLGETGGVKSVTLTSAQSGLPAHSHSISDPSHSHYLDWRNNINVANFTGAFGSVGSNSAGNTYGSTTGISINNNTAADAAQAHTNLQPYIIVNYIIKT